MQGSRTKRNERQHKDVNALSYVKLVEIAFWGSVIWGIARIIASFFDFTPYGLRVFSRPLTGMAAEDTPGGIVVGVLLYFIMVIASTLIYYYLFSQFTAWWLALAY